MSHLPPCDAAAERDASSLIKRSPPAIPPRSGSGPPRPRKTQSDRASAIDDAVDVSVATADGDSTSTLFVDTSESKLHKLIAVSVSCPQLCAICEDYVVSPRCIAFQCSHCDAIFHSVCSHVVTCDNRFSCPRHSSSPSHGTFVPIDPEICKNTNKSNLISAVSTSEQPLAQWNRFQVAHWLTVVGLSRFVMLFLRRRVDGETLLKLVPFSPQLDQVVDPFARQALRRAILVLSGQQPGAGENVGAVSDILSHSLALLRTSCTPPLSATTANPGESHNLAIFSFLREVACNMCKLPLLGLFRQGYQCSSCGIILHKVCKAIYRLPPCESSPIFEDAVSIYSGDLATLDSHHLPTVLLPYSSAYFGIPLIDQPLDPSTFVPYFLISCTTVIERLATQSLSDPTCEPVDLASAYQQSASTVTLSELHRQYAFTLPTAGSPGDVVRLSQLLKAFLRDLPTPVIPEQNYAEFCSLSSASVTGESVRQFLTGLPDQHRATLVHVMKHLGFVWNHQLSLRSRCSIPVTPADSYRRNPVTWLLVFRQILIRPPWDMITDLTTSLNRHLKALQVLFDSIVSPTRDHLSPTVSRPILPGVLTLGRSSPGLGMKAVSGVPVTEYGQIDLSDLTAAKLDSDGPTVNTLPTSSSTAENKRDLATREWFWGDLTQTELRDLMDGLPDGYFLVRTASETSAGAFTLAIRHHGENKLIRIYHRGDFFGVVDPPPPVFRLVSELIQYYRTHTAFDGESLQLQPVSRMHFRFHGASDSAPASASTRPSGSDQPTSATIDAGVFACYLSENELLAELGRADRELAECNAQIKELAALGESAMQRKCEASSFGQGYSKLKQWLELQRTRLSEYSSPRECERLAHQHQLVKDKLAEVDKEIEEYNRQFATHSDEYRALFQDQVDIASRCRKLRRQAQEIRRALKDRGVSADAIHRRAPKVNDSGISDRSQRASSSCSRSGSVSAQLDAISDRTTWFLTDVSREHAETLLRDKPAGTFLIRSSQDGQKLALSVSLSSSVQHCLIYNVDNHYGFVRRACTFDTLEALVMFYHMKSLKQHNPMLTTTLRYPIFSKPL